MSSPLGPARPGDPPAARASLRVAGVALVASALFWSPLIFGGALQGGDWATHHFHYFDWVRQSLTAHWTIPLYMSDAWVSQNFIANAEAPSLGPLAWLLVALPTGVYVKLLIVVFTAAGLAGSWLLLRDLGVAAPLAVLAAVAFAWGGFFVSHVTLGHHWAMGGWLLPLFFWLFRRGALGSGGALVAAAVLDAFTIMGGQHQPFIWQNLMLGAFALLWAVGARDLFPVRAFAIVVGVAAGLGAVKLLPMAFEFGDYAPTAHIQGLPLASLLPSLAAPGLGRGFVDPRIAYEFGAGWWEYAFYVGPVALGLLVGGCLIGVRDSWPLLLVGVFFLVISVEAMGVWPLIEGLPVWRSQRSPSRFLVLAIFAVSVSGAIGLQRLVASPAARWPRARLVLAWLVAAGVGLDLFRESLPWQQLGVGAPIEARDHRPRPLIRQTREARMELVEFSPNRLVYLLNASRPAVVTLPVRFGKRHPEWEVEGGELRASGQLLAVRVEPGVSEVVLSYRPPGLRSGLAISLLTVVAAISWLVWRRRQADR